MSISLAIDWADGRTEDVAISSLRGAQWWAEEGKKLGLELVPLFRSALAIEPGMLEQLDKEVTVFRDHIGREGREHPQALAAADRLLNAFQRLKQSSGWSASIG